VLLNDGVRGMKRREFIAVVGGAAVWPLAVRAQQPAMPVIGYLSLGSPDSDINRVIGLRRGLNEAGYVENQGVTIEYRWAHNLVDRLPALATDLVQHQVVVIVAPGVFSTLAAKAATQIVPIVFIVGVDPVQLALVKALNRPGGNLTGFNVISGELGAKGLEVLHELLPTTTTIGFLENPRNPLSEPRTRDVLTAARAIGAEIKVLHASTEAEIDAAFATLAQPGALLVSNDIFFGVRITQLVALAAQYAVPTLYTVREFTSAGGLMSYGFSLADIYRLAGLQVARILKGEKPADLPVIQAAKIELVINLKTAKALGLTIPRTLLARADELIE
jgi:putative tryptophan/tyrosine transport system substrate-binding protein